MSPLVSNGILTVLILSCIISVAQGILCHSCQYSKCADPYDVVEYADNEGDCDDDQYCVKYKTVVWIRNSGEITGNWKESHVVTRSCESKKGQKEGCVGWQNNGGITLKCWCGSDGCNKGLALKSTSSFLLLSVVSGLIVTIFSLRH